MSELLQLFESLGDSCQCPYINDSRYAHLPFETRRVEFLDSRYLREGSSIDLMFLEPANADPSFAALVPSPDIWVNQYVDLGFLKNSFDGTSLTIGDASALRQKCSPLTPFGQDRVTDEDFQLRNWNRINKYLFRGFQIPNIVFKATDVPAFLDVYEDAKLRFSVFDLNLADSLGWFPKELKTVLLQKCEHGQMVPVDRLFWGEMLEDAATLRFGRFPPWDSNESISKQIFKSLYRTHLFAVHSTKAKLF